MKIISILLSLFLFPYLIFSQSTVSFEEAVEELRDQNLQLLISSKNTAIAENNTSRLNRGFLPNIALNGGSQYTYGNSHAKYNNENIQDININGAGYLSGNAGAFTSYALLDGGRRRYTNLKNETALEQAVLEQIQTEEDVIFALAQLYYGIAKTEKGLDVLQSSYEISSKRLERASYSLEFGQGSSIDVLNAKVDVQRDSLNLWVLEQRVQNLKHELNALLNRSVEFQFNTDTIIALQEYKDFDTWLESTVANNSSLKVYDKRIASSLLDERLALSPMMPSLNIDAGFNYNFVDNPDDAFVKFQSSEGIQAGLSINWNIFDGGANRVRVQNSKIVTEINQVFKEDLLNQLRKDVMVLWNDYQTNLSIIENEKVTIEIANRNFIRSQELFNNARISSVEFRQAQLNQLSSQLNYYNALYDAKLNEIELEYIAGKLLK